MKESSKTGIRDLGSTAKTNAEDRIEAIKNNNPGIPGVSEEQVEEDVELINPDPDSMESRG